MLPSDLGHPLSSGLKNRFMFITLRRSQKIITATNTKKARISKLPIKKSYSPPRKLKIL